VPGEITEFIEKNSKFSVDSVAKPTKLDTLQFLPLSGYIALMVQLSLLNCYHLYKIINLS